MMEITKIKSRQLDEILKKLLTLKNPYNTHQMQKDLFPDESYEYCLSLFYILNDYNPSLLYPKTEVTFDCFWAREYVSAFLNNGGFSNIYDNIEQEDIKKQEYEKLNLEKLKYDTKNAKRVYKTYWFTFVIAIIALLISIYNLIKDLIK